MGLLMGVTFISITANQEIREWCFQSPIELCECLVCRTCETPSLDEVIFNISIFDNSVELSPYKKREGNNTSCTFEDLLIYLDILSLNTELPFTV